MIIYIYGEDDFRSREQLKKMVAEFKQKRDPQGYNVVFLYCAKIEPSKVFSEIMSAPFLAEKRMVVLENILSNNDKEFLGEMVERVQNCHSERSEESLKLQAKKDPSIPQDDNATGMTTKKGFPESTIIIFYQSENLSKIKEVKELDVLLQKEKFAQEFKALSGSELSNWVKKEVEARGGKISVPAQSFLAQNSGQDIWRLNSLLDQLVAYAGDKEIGIKDTELFLDEKVDDNIFNMVDAIVAGNKSLAFKLLEKQRQMGQDEMYLFLMILRQFRILLQLRSAYEENENARSDDLAKQLGIHPFVVKKSWSSVKRFSLAQLKVIYTKLLEIDFKTKTGLAPQALLLDLFIGNQ